MTNTGPATPFEALLCVAIAAGYGLLCYLTRYHSIIGPLGLGD